MDFSSVMNSIIAYFQTHTAIAVATAIVLLYLLLRRTKLFFTLLLIAAVVIGVFYMISSISSIGVQKKDILIHKSDMP